MAREPARPLAAASVTRTLAGEPAVWTGLLDPGGPLPPVVTSWLGSLGVLDGVPFNYLVPDDRMLPPESVRFFYVDPNWIAAARDGALSIGRETSFDRAHDDALAPVAAAVAGERAAGERARRLGTAEPEAPAAAEVQTGVLLRSALIADWPGLEVRGYADPEAADLLPTAHQTLLAPSVKICIFDGVVQRVDLSEPQEGMQFGADQDDQGAYQRGLRGLGQGSVAIGVPIDASVEVPMRPGAKPGVIDVATLVGKLSDGLVAADAWTAGHALDAADFAIEMIEPPQHAALIAQGQPPPPAPAAPRPAAPRARELVDEGARALDDFLREELADG